MKDMILYFLNNNIIRLLVFFNLLLVQNSFAQWKTQSINLKPGWNGVYLHVNSSFSNIEDLDELDPNITDIWLWKPKLKSDQYIQNPSALWVGVV